MSESTRPLTTNDVLTELRRLEKRVESGGHYGFEQSIWTRAADELDRLTADNKRLREALNAFKRDSYYADSPYAHDLADAALKEQP